MESTGVGVVVFLVLLFAPALQGMLKSIAFRLRAAGKAEMMRAERTSDMRARTGCRSGKRGRRG
ncbi:hypothetical protein [Streptomyces diastatochromogenes]|uniref:Uncharacterized protein n=1 Tax=Streptomyces diastatochromogenes TaxID=42236 RepID=A0A233S7R7_STRDA|nr:hypothetical protein [Streptomyces diastatochromogenes]MCZ0985011.1 hypothetical protein [Streptomyces diastatochromogenes]OXY91715.1 hypothetical protein BEK98_28815 [Streptomyces diastatochromogenes]